MSAKNFKLIYQGRVDDSPVTRKNLLELMESNCGFGRVIEIDYLLDGPPFTISRSPDKADLERLSRPWQQAGAKVAIVSPNGATEPATRRHSFKTFYEKYTQRLADILASMDVGAVESLAEELLSAREEKRQIFVFGNGGSAATASHMANDFAKERFDDENSLFRVMSLTDNVSWMTATANDYGYDLIFVNQLKNLLQPGDLVIAISSSGNSPNITKAIDYARDKGALTYGIVGFDGGALKKKAERTIHIPSKKGQYGYMEDVTSILSHILSIFIYERDRETFGKR